MEHYYHGEDANGEKLDRGSILLQYINDKGYDVTYQHDLVELIQDENGIVTGAIFETPNGYVLRSSGMLSTSGLSVKLIKASTLADSLTHSSKRTMPQHFRNFTRKRRLTHQAYTISCR